MDAQTVFAPRSAILDHVAIYVFARTCRERNSYLVCKKNWKGNLYQT